MFCPITPQKRNYPCLITLDECHLKELSPFPHKLPVSSHRKPNSLELLTSPLPTYRDLFSQLLATQLKTPKDNQDLIIENEACEQGEGMEYLESQSQSNFLQDIDEQSSSEDGIKKRKRKSTAQIKVLRQELELEANWTKDKIVEMSEVTGLSQSQVYKWWWDQKKKNARNEGYRLAKQKVGHRDFERRLPPREKEEGGWYSPGEAYANTKVKMNVNLEQLPETERKVNKRLVFG